MHSRSLETAEIDYTGQISSYTQRSQPIKEIRTSDRSQSDLELPRVRTRKTQAGKHEHPNKSSKPAQTNERRCINASATAYIFLAMASQGVQIPSGSVPTAKEIIAPADSVSSIHDPVYEPHAVHGAAIVPDQLPPTPPVAGLSNDDVTLEVCMHLCIYFSLHLIAACVLKDYSIVISPYAMF